jgi:hypothetical protein
LNDTLLKQFLTQLNSIIEDYKPIQVRLNRMDISDRDLMMVHGLITRSRAAVVRATGQDSEYNQQIQLILAMSAWDSSKLNNIIGVVESLALDIQAGYLSSASELIHGELFGDFLEMADHLLEEGYKDAAAVIAGSALEAHIRQLCIKNDIPIEVETSKGIQPKKADSMNSDLTSVSAISKLDQKNVTAWLDLRNKAAHGKYDEYGKEQVALMIAGVRDFITRNTA